MRAAASAVQGERPHARESGGPSPDLFCIATLARSVPLSMTTSIRLWLDDERDPRDPGIQQRFGAAGDEVWVRTVGEAIAWLERHGPLVVSVSLDNDLGVPGTENEGFRSARWIEERAVRGIAAPPAECKVHSANPVRRGEMLVAFANARRAMGGC